MTSQQVTEVNLVCMSGQGSVQTLELMARAYYEQHSSHVASVVFPGARAKSTPVVSYLKVSDRPIASTSTNFDPSVVVVFSEGLLRVAYKNGHDVIRSAITSMRRGLLLVNTLLPPEEIELPFDFEGKVATVDATGIARRHLNRNPPPVGITLLGAFAAVTGALDLEKVLALVREHFPGKVGDANVAAAREAAQSVQVRNDVRGRALSGATSPTVFLPDEIPSVEPIAKPLLRGHGQGSPFIWRDKIPVCKDTMCKCENTCLSESVCPDATGFIVRNAIEGAKQGYRVDVDFCRGCGLCAEVCVYGALTMEDENERLRTHPNYAGISVASFLPKPAHG